MKLSSFDAILNLGDLDYKCLPDKYFTDVLDSKRNYQFMSVIGNHDAKSQCPDEVAKKFLNNVYDEMINKKNKDINCEFSESKFMWSCKYKNMRIIGLSPSIKGADNTKEQLRFLKKHLTEAKEDWKICSWHFYDKYYHTGKYQEYGNIVSGDGHDDESFYDFCKDHGAIIFSAHDHVYARTNVMSKFKKPVIDEYDLKTGTDIVQIREGATFNILNGVGGWEIYIEQGEQKDYSHWVKKYARGEHNENAIRFGGLFCKFNLGGNNRKAYCEFKRINSSDKVFDKFYIYRNDSPEDILYSEIDDNFLQAKISAYEIKNNIKSNLNDNDNDSKNSNNTQILNDNFNISSQEKNKNSSNIFSIKNILIFGSIISIIIIIVGGTIIYKEAKRIRNEEKSNKEESNEKKI
ncbi:hypothetical protein H8356DRAFT_1407546 [Neocallimastix lanati (nom. inval.)]|uniref:Calcineurin-like phosphoesterase domain-containing protein n=1 Tax=Neocallimastix californiae TaxID=1754190 RepID=A0A1Y2FLZ6_9FUNG|nr:hypothetical protein H8356DRAFT_1407546 [Neocallimastix sp. JGI-2020a]ORY84617.1 hypothetical protein LY90DRAFT_640804 [Neocallimastix californiae]|eukprot:ORY84617.1 hypothetical protein LY90DRAFT_640804 [Neocallimastix californiae]